MASKQGPLPDINATPRLLTRRPRQEPLRIGSKRDLTSVFPLQSVAPQRQLGTPGQGSHSTSAHRLPSVTPSKFGPLPPLHTSHQHPWLKEKEKDEKKEPFKNLCKSPEDSGASCVLDTRQSDRMSEERTWINEEVEKTLREQKKEFKSECENLKQLRISLERERGVELDRLKTQMAESTKQLQGAKRELTNVLVYLKEEWNRERLKLREENENFLKQLRVSQETERVAERDRLEAQMRQEMERLKAESEKELQEEKRRLKELIASVQEEWKWETLKLREENENFLKQLRVSQETERVAERDRLEAQMRQEMERFKAESEKELQEEKRRLKELMVSVQEEWKWETLKRREENENFLKQLRVSQETERVVERDRLEAQMRQEMERLKAESEKELQEEKRRLKELMVSVQEEWKWETLKCREENENLKQLRVSEEKEGVVECDRLEARKAESEKEIPGEMRTLKELIEPLQEWKWETLKRREESEKENVGCVKQEVKESRKEQHLSDYEQEMADILKDRRDETQRDHENKLEVDHSREMKHVREKNMDEEFVLRRQMNEEIDRLQAGLKDLRQQMQNINMEHSQFEDVSRPLSFGLSESELNSTVDTQDKTAGHSNVLTEVTKLLEEISENCNTLLPGLRSQSQQQRTTGFTQPLSPCHSIPTTTTSTSTSLSLGPSSLASAPPLTMTDPSWNRVPQGSSTAPSLSTRISSVLSTGAAMDPITSSTLRTPSAYLSHMPFSHYDHSLEPVYGSKEWYDLKMEEIKKSNRRWQETWVRPLPAYLRTKL